MFKRFDYRTSHIDKVWLPRLPGGRRLAFFNSDELTWDALASPKTPIAYYCGEYVREWPKSFLAAAAKDGVKPEPGKIDGLWIFHFPDGTRLFLYPMSVWFGENCGDKKECMAAFFQLYKLMQDATRNLKNERHLVPRYTPAITGRTFFKTYMPSKEIFPPIQNDYLNLILPPSDKRTTRGRIGTDQSRLECYKKSGTGSQLYYFDHRQMYQTVMMGSMSLPSGDIFQSPNILSAADLSSFRPHKPAWYQVTARVPDDWTHIGLVQCNGEWINEPGREFTGWFSEPETRLLCMPNERVFGNSIPGIATDWRPVIHNKLWFGLTDNDGIKGGEGFKRALEKISEIENSPEAQKHPLIKSACRRIAHDGLGSLNPGKSFIQNQSLSEDEYLEWLDTDVDAQTRANIVRDPNDKSRILISENDLSNRSGNVAPQIAAQVWAHARARVTTAMLEIPFDDIIGCQSDAIFLTREHDFKYYHSRFRKSVFRSKGVLTEKFKMPRSVSELNKLSLRIKEEGN